MPEEVQRFPGFMVPEGGKWSIRGSRSAKEVKTGVIGGSSSDCGGVRVDHMG